MKKTSLHKKYWFFFAGCLFLLNFVFISCGLDVFEVIPSPTSVIHQPDYNTEDSVEKYFNFWTKEDFDLSNYYFLGTEIYYKIYNNVNTMSSERSTLESLASSTTSANSADRMIASYKYQPLLFTGKEAVSIPSSGSNKEVYIRLSNYQDSQAFSARVCIGGKDVLPGDSGFLGVPLRTTEGGSHRTFDFGRTGDENAVPAEGDIDVNYSSTSTDEDKKKWYVQLFAVGVARDNSFSLNYSNVLYLGAVTIDSSSIDN